MPKYIYIYKCKKKTKQKKTINKECKIRITNWQKLFLNAHPKYDVVQYNISQSRALSVTKEKVYLLL